MKLSDVDIHRYLAAGELEVDPRPKENQIGAMSIDLHLGPQFRFFTPGKAAFVDLHSSDRAVDIDHLMSSHVSNNSDPFYLHPGDFALGITKQRVALPADLAGRLDGRSSLARLGLMVHATAHTIDPGWNGRITLEFFNCGPLPLALRPGIRICAISFETLMSPTSKPYSTRADSKYKEQLIPVPSLFSKDHSME
jgi:dCTP deaminase